MKTMLRAAALALAAATSTVALTAPAAAQDLPFHPTRSLAYVQFVSHGWSVSGTRYLDTWPNKDGSIAVSLHGDGTLPDVKATLNASPDGKRLEGKIVEGPDVGQAMTVSLENYVATVALGGKSAFNWSAPYYGRAKSNDAYLEKFLGRWTAVGGEVTFTAEHGVLTGVYKRPASTGMLDPLQRFAFSYSVLNGNRDDMLGGAWADGKDDRGGQAQIDFVPASGQLVIHYTNTAGEQTMVLKKAPLTEAEQAARLRPAAGDPAPKPGYVQCAGWCRLKVAGYRVFSQPWGNGSYRPVLAVTLKIHNATEREQRLDHIYQPGSQSLRLFVAGATQPDNGTWASNVAMGPMPLKPGPSDGSPARLTGSTGFPAGSEVSTDYWVTVADAEADRLWVEFAGTLRGTIEAKEMICAYFRRAAELAKEGTLYQGLPTAVPQRCGTAEATGGEAAGPGAGTGSSGEVGSAEAPAPGSSQSGGSAGGTASASGGGGRWPAQSGTAEPDSAADGFKALIKYGVRLEAVNDRGDGRTEVIAVLKNRTSAPLYLTSGQLVAYGEDGDGVGQEQRQIWRAGSEPPALFAATPVIQPGATLRARWMFHTEKGKPIGKLRFSEGTKTADFGAG